MAKITPIEASPLGIHKQYLSGETTRTSSTYDIDLGEDEYWQVEEYYRNFFGRDEGLDAWGEVGPSHVKGLAALEEDDSSSRDFFYQGDLVTITPLDDDAADFIEENGNSWVVAFYEPFEEGWHCVNIATQEEAVLRVSDFNFKYEKSYV